MKCLEIGPGKKPIKGFESLNLSETERTEGTADYIGGHEKIINEFALMRNKWLGMFKVLDQRPCQITNVVKLRVAGMEDASL